MTIEIALDKDYEKELVITVPWEVVKEDYENLLKQYSKLPVKGFRQGKSPVGMIESFFARQIKNDLIASISPRLCRTALKEKEMEAGTPIEISDGVLNKNENLQFKAAFIAMPPFELPDYANLSLAATENADKLDEISRKLLDRTNIDLHTSFIDNELRYSENGGDEVEAAQRVKLMLILKKIATQDGIEVDSKEVDKRIEEIAAENGVTSEYLKRFLIDNGGMARFADSLLAEAVLDYIIEIQN